jgi:hypothetical protein
MPLIFASLLAGKRMANAQVATRYFFIETAHNDRRSDYLPLAEKVKSNFSGIKTSTQDFFNSFVLLLAK